MIIITLPIYQNAVAIGIETYKSASLPVEPRVEEETGKFESCD